MAEQLKKLIGDKVQGKNGEVAVDSFCGDGKIVGLYFSAHWCPPCRAFTPQLAQFYKNIHEAKKLEIVFVSSDRDEKSFNGYYNEMPWLAMPYDDKYSSREDLMSHFGLRGIPSLVFIDGATGKEITKDGRAEVMKDVSGAAFPSWKK